VDALPNILIVEDDVALAESLSDELVRLNYRTKVAGDGQLALQMLGSDAFDAVLLDLMLPMQDGLTVLGRLRAESVTVPVIILSALGRSSEKIEGLDRGADDYVVKPVEPAELDARLRAVLRARRWAGKAADTLQVRDIMVSPTRHRAWRAGKIVDLPKIEFDLLAELARNVDTVLTRAVLIERVWGYDFEPATNIVDNYVRRLRVRLMADGGDDPILTVRGVGYALKS